jgi:hypothetical protein
MYEHVALLATSSNHLNHAMPSVHVMISDTSSGQVVRDGQRLYPNLWLFIAFMQTSAVPLLSENKDDQIRLASQKCEIFNAMTLMTLANNL